MPSLIPVLCNMPRAQRIRWDMRAVQGTNTVLIMSCGRKRNDACILCDGSNNYKIPHMSKGELERKGEIPLSILVSEELGNKINI
jgi:hypothetical protein